MRKTTGRCWTAEYRTWSAIRCRCNSPNNKDFHNYGGRGIKVCERWNVYENFLADMGPRPDGFTIERINNFGDYEPENCAWIPMADQAKNRRNSHPVTINEKTMMASEWCKIYGINYKTYKTRVWRSKLTPEQALSEPLHLDKKKLVISLIDV